MKMKIRNYSFIDFKIFKSHGLLWDHQMLRIGCKNLCNPPDGVAQEVVKEFYDNLELLKGFRLKFDCAERKSL